MTRHALMDFLLEPPFVLVKPGITEDEFYRLADEDLDAEYLDGRIVMYSPASDQHEDVFGFLLTLVRSYLERTDEGIVRGSRLPMRLDERWSPEPDLFVVRKDRLHLLGPQRLEGPADLVVEIISPHHRTQDLDEKRPAYHRHHVPEAWWIDPERRELVVDVAEAGAYRTRTLERGRLESKAVPGFWIEVDWLWARPHPSTLGCLRAILPGA